jgi:hypothetical protein
MVTGMQRDFFITKVFEITHLLLKYATQHIDAQIHLLMNYLARFGISLKNSLSNALVSTREGAGALIPANNEELKTLLSNIKRQVAETLRQVVDILGKYAGLCLSGEARDSVKGFILSLPSRWAFINSRFSSFSKPPSAPNTSTPGEAEGKGVSEDAMQEAQKVFTLATESSAMLKGIQSVFESAVGEVRPGMEITQQEGGQHPQALMMQGPATSANVNGAAQSNVAMMDEDSNNADEHFVDARDMDTTH